MKSINNREEMLPNMLNRPGSFKKDLGMILFVLYLIKMFFRQNVLFLHDNNFILSYYADCSIGLYFPLL